MTEEEALHALREQLIALTSQLEAGRAEAVRLFNHAVPAIAKSIEDYTTDQRRRGVLIVADRSEPGGRAISDEVLRMLRRTAPDGTGEELFYSLQPAKTVVRLLSRLGLVPLPQLSEEPAPGALRLLIVAAGIYSTFEWTPMLSKGGSA